MMKAQGQIITSSLQTELDNAGPSDILAITITMSEQYDIATISHLLENMTRQERRQLVVSELKSFSNTSQQSIMNMITSLEVLGQIENVRQFWIVNMITCKAKPAAINQLAQRQDIGMIHIDEFYEIGEIGTDSGECLENPPDIPYHINLMNVPTVWDKGYKGEDVVVAVIDTGVDYWHPDLIDNMWDGLGYNVLDPGALPMDDVPNHGTHVAGIIAGNGESGSKTGISPKAKIMAVKVFDNRYGVPPTTNFHSNVMAGVQWSVDHGADLLNISLGDRIIQSGTENLVLWRQMMDNVLATGRVAVVSAGNHPEGTVPPPPNQINVPGNVPSPWRHIQQTTEGSQSAVVCVGATNQNDAKWDKSCIGPVTWQNVSWPGVGEYDDYHLNQWEIGLIRPDVVAPGVDIVSSHFWFNTQTNKREYCYTEKTGTSMSAPAVVGVMALMLSKNPYLTPSDLDEIIEMTAIHPSNHPNLDRYKDNEIGSGRVNAFEAIEMVPDCDLIIYNNEVLNETIFYCDIIVKSGGTLTINQNLWFARNSKVIVEPGGKLIVDGAKISRLNNEMWQGIEVWGNSEENQLPNAQGNYAQGYLNLNNATIENALTAVSLWKPGDNSTTGGIVIANNTTFRNNKKAVHALNYTNTHPDTFLEMDYVATFTRCSFEIDEDYPGTGTFSKHVDLDRVKGVKFRGCDFLLSVSPDAANVSYFNKGIASYSAGFTANAICNSSTIPCNDYDSCTFTGFAYAIYAVNNYETTRTFYVNRAQFNRNAYGIYTTGINNFTVLNSEFYIGYNEPESDPCDAEGKSASGCGIHMTGCRGFAIEENYFTKPSGAPQGNYTGILCKDSETEHDIIYRNIFSGLSYGNFAEGNNRSSPNDLHGLEYQCNFNTGNNRDFIVTGEYYPQIRGYQGSMSREAGNTFSTDVQLPDGHFKNTGIQVINYCYNTNPPVYYTPFYVLPIPNAGTNTCPPNYGGGGGSTEDVVLTEDEKQEVELAFANNLSDFNNVKVLFNNLEDGGNTQALITEVETSWPSDMWALRAELLGKSPHLSQEVLMAAADKTDVLPESILFEILSANPDELRKEELISHLENKDQPLPAYMISILRQLAGGVTYKTILQHDMARYQAGKIQAAYSLIRSCLNDTVTDYTYLRNWLNNLDNLNADMQIVAAYLAEDNYTAAQTMLNLIPATRNLEGNALAGYNDYKSIMQMQMAWQQQGRSIFELDSLEVDMLVDFAKNASGKTAMMAKGILEYAFGYHYCNCLPVDDPAAWKSSAAMPRANEARQGLFIQAVPNPASTWVSFNFKLPVHVNEAVLQITDVHGKSITSFVITAKQGQQVWDIRDMKKGIYLYSLKAGAVSKNGKLVIN